MSRGSEHDDSDPIERGNGFGVRRHSPGRAAQADSFDDHEHANDHVALIYEDSRDQFDAVVPFVKQGLEQDERCVYVADDNDIDDVLDAMADRGIDVDDALESDSLVVHTPEDTYRRTGTFEREAMMEYVADALTDAKADGFAGFRAAAEMTWALDDETEFDDLVAYEALLNPLYDGEDYVVMCQYNRSRFPAAVVDDVIETHPHIVYDGIVSRNGYYTPPAEFFGPDDPEREVERKLRTLGERAEMQTRLDAQDRHLRDLYEVTADTDRTFEEKLQAVFDLGCEYFGMDLGGMARVDVDDDRFEVDVTNADHEYLVPGETYPLSETYCQVAVLEEGTRTVADPRTEGLDDRRCFERFGVQSYIGTCLQFDGADDRTLWFVSGERRSDGFTEAEQTVLHMMGQWARYELERRQYERDLETTVDRLRQSNDRLEQFAYAASHDLQEPLRMVSSYLRLLESEYRDDLDAQARDYIDFAVDGADRMREMVDDLLAFSRVEHAEGSFESVNAEAVVERVTDDLATQIDANDVEVVVADLPTVVAEPDQLKLLVRNLVSNAVKYGGDGHTTVEITADRHDDHWEFAVADDGIGIDPDQTDRIFKLFKRLHHEDEHSGTGIGLALCQEIVENHGGYVWVESEPGEGSTFSFTLPVREAE